MAAVGEQPTPGVAVSIVAPRAAEISTWTPVRVDVTNATADPAQAHLTVTLPFAQARVGGCTRSDGVECELMIAGGTTASVPLQVRWNGSGRKTIDARAQLAAAPDSAGAAATASVSVYLLALRGLRTSPSPARAGLPFVATATLARSDTGAPLRPRSLRCPAVIAAAPRAQPLAVLRGSGTMRGSRLTCTWRLPASARGKFVRALVLADTHAGGMLTKYPFWRSVR